MLTDELNILDFINVPEVSWNTRFWLVRSKSGAFFEEFISHKFIALAWNEITQKDLNSIQTKQEKQKLQEKLKQVYGDDVKIRGAYNKCEHFVYDINPGDILMIPGPRSKSIALARAGEYFELNEFSAQREIEVTKQIDEGWDDTLSIPCPYNKRRHIEILRILEGDNIHPNLYKALVSYHGISRIDDIADTVLNSIYNMYYYNGHVTCVFNVQKKEKINTKELAGFMYNLSLLANNVADDKDISSKVNLNSPGDITMSIDTLLKTGTDFLKSDGWVFILLWGALFGGKFFGCEFNSLIDIVMKFRDQNSRLKTETINRGLLEEQLKNIQKTSETLQIKKDDNGNVINFNKILKQKKND